MYKAEVRIIETQQEENKTIEVSNWEKEQLLAKYGYQTQINPSPSRGFDPTRDLTYQQMIELEDQKYKQELANRNRLQQTPTYTIDPYSVNYNESKWSNMDVDGQQLGFQIQIVSDMKINR